MAEVGKNNPRNNPHTWVSKTVQTVSGVSELKFLFSMAIV